MTLILSSIVLKFVLFLFCYALILYRKKMVLVDIFWGLSFLPEFFIAFIFKGFTHGNIILFLMVLLWSIRLSFHLGVRASQKKEDIRYLKFAKNWPSDKFNSKVFTKIILTQFAVSVLMSTCFYVYLFAPSFGWSAPFWNVPLLILFLIGFTIEVLADESLRRFKNKPENKDFTYTGSVWKVLRYPNYLGEIMIWISFGLLALPFTYGWLALVSPITITYFLTYVTGIPYLETRRSKRIPKPNLRPKKYYIPFVF